MAADRRSHDRGLAVPAAPADASAAVVTLIDSIASKPVEWLWRHRIPAGMLTILDGDPGLGKSMLTLDLAARLSTGRPMPGESASRVPGGVVILSAEDDPARTIRLRLEAAGADLSRIALVAIREPDGTTREPAIAADDLRAVELAIRQVDAALLVIDPLMAYLPDAVNANRDHDIRRSLSLLSGLAERTGAAIVVVRHLRKSAADGNPLYRGGGSIGIIGAARAGLLVALDPDDPSGERRVLAATKANLAPLPGSLSFSVEVESGGQAPRAVWHGTTDHRAADLLRTPERDADAPAESDAESFLRELLADGPVPAKQVAAEAREAGLSWATVRRAQARLGIRPRKVGRPGEPQAWLWTLANAEAAHEMAKVLMPRKMSTFGPDEHLGDADIPDGPADRVDDDYPRSAWDPDFDAETTWTA